MEGKYLFLPFSRNHSGCERSFHFSLLNIVLTAGPGIRLGEYTAIRRASSLLSNLGAAAYLKPYSRAIADMGI
jgi:hypothetical protein